MLIPEDLRYAETHEWVRLEGDVATIGITDHAQSELTDLVYVELPEVGKALGDGDESATVESVKTASDIYAPLAGTVIEINLALEDTPGTVNDDPYGEGWIYKLQVDEPSAIEDLMDAESYREFLS
jgi:glycine cleavage system H protein